MSVGHGTSPTDDFDLYAVSLVAAELVWGFMAGDGACVLWPGPGD